MSSATRIRILMVDGHDLFRIGLASLLAETEDLEVVAQASRGTMGVRLAAELLPDVVLMDLRISDLDGPAAAQAILERDASARIVALTIVAGELDVIDAVDAGFCGYVLKESPIDDVAAAIRAAACGTAWLSPRAAQALLMRVRREHLRAAQAPVPSYELSARLDMLSPRQIEVLQSLARGLDNHEIATELSISPRTAKNHVSAILSKLGVDNRVQAAVCAADAWPRRASLLRSPRADPPLPARAAPHAAFAATADP